jgi:hypothetical protein
MDEIVSYKMCAVKVRNAKLRNYLKQPISNAWRPVVNCWYADLCDIRSF